MHIKQYSDYLVNLRNIAQPLDVVIPFPLKTLKPRDYKLSQSILLKITMSYFKTQFDKFRSITSQEIMPLLPLKFLLCWTHL